MMQLFVADRWHRLTRNVSKNALKHARTLGFLQSKFMGLLEGAIPNRTNERFGSRKEQGRTQTRSSLLLRALRHKERVAMAQTTSGSARPNREIINQ